MERDPTIKNLFSNFQYSVKISFLIFRCPNYYFTQFVVTSMNNLTSFDSHFINRLQWSATLSFSPSIVILQIDFFIIMNLL